MPKIYHESKDGRFIWTHCPVCDKLMVVTNKRDYELDPPDGKQICELTEAILYPKKYYAYEKGCLKDKWSMHLIPTYEGEDDGAE